MALNLYMHIRNQYKFRKPSFRDLYSKYGFFRDVAITDDNGKVTLDFKQPKHLAALSRALLLEDFNLDVEFPLDRLVPTIPLRLNYILWIEDILENMSSMTPPPLILDIGVGSSCIYPLLGARKNNWKFIGVESDARNFNSSLSVVESNSLQDYIYLLRVHDPLVSPLHQVFDELSKSDFSGRSPFRIDVVMANPPFFSDVADAVAVESTRSLSRCPAKSASSAARQESQTPGGEVGFATRLAEDSLNFSGSVGVFTLMLGKKRSVPLFRKKLLELGITQNSVYEMCQGRVMRWGVAWTFIPNFKFPVSEFRNRRKFRRPPLTFTLPERVSCLSAYNRKTLLQWLSEEFKQLNMRVLLQKNPAILGGHHLLIEAHEDTWTHSRRRRREALRRQALAANSELMECSTSTSPGSSAADSVPTEVSLKRPHETATTPLLTTNEVQTSKQAMVEELNTEFAAKRARLQRLCEEGEAWIEELESDDQISLNADHTDVLATVASDLPLLLRANVYVESELHGCGDEEEEEEFVSGETPDGRGAASDAGDLANDKLIVKIECLDGKDREAANRVLFYLKNKLK
uniref:U6 small nuclear RNA (adenine-(43)-N(6))-methyltransferase n=1 Tax=Schistocephalus solidus TaxID=70667 RepID=A0A0V0J5U6_SCHSO